MKRVVLGIILVIILSNQTQAFYVQDGTILLLRSQYTQDYISIDGALTEDAWSRAGSLHISYNNLTMSIYFMNDDNRLYMGIEVSDTTAGNDSIGLYFDIDGDGILTTPEDAKVLNYTSSFSWHDLYWDGNGWVADKVASGKDKDFNAWGKQTGDKFVYEFMIALVSENVVYDGFQITNPSNTIISFTVSVNNGNQEFYSFPALPTNASGYIDLKLAGPEDQDLPEYIPPTTVTDTVPIIQNPTDIAGNIQAAGMSGFEFVIVFAGAMVIQLIWRKRK